TLKNLISSVLRGSETLKSGPNLGLKDFVFNYREGRIKMTRRLLALVIFALAAIAPAFGKDKMPTAEQVVDKYIQAIGGKAAYEKLNTRMEKGTFEFPAMGATGSVEGYSKAPNKNIVVVSIEGVGEFKQGFTGTEAWSLNPMSGMRV